MSFDFNNISNNANIISSAELIAYDLNKAMVKHGLNCNWVKHGDNFALEFNLQKNYRELIPLTKHIEQVYALCYSIHENFMDIMNIDVYSLLNTNKTQYSFSGICHNCNDFKFWEIIPATQDTVYASNVNILALLHYYKFINKITYFKNNVYYNSKSTIYLSIALYNDSKYSYANLKYDNLTKDNWDILLATIFANKESFNNVIVHTTQLYYKWLTCIADYYPDIIDNSVCQRYKMYNELTTLTQFTEDVLTLLFHDNKEKEVFVNNSKITI